MGKHMLKGPWYGSNAGLRSIVWPSSLTWTALILLASRLVAGNLASDLAAFFA